MNEQRGKFIVLESGEGGGKGTVRRFLEEQYKDQDNIVFTREPGGTPIAEEIRSLILNPNHKGMAPLTEFLLFYAARAEHIANFVRPMMKEGRIVICERADLSTIAYQIYGRKREDFLAVVEYLSALVWGIPIFDGIIYLDVDPKIGLARIAKQRGMEIDRIEREGIEFHTRVREGFLKLYNKRTFGTWHKIDASQSIEVVQREVLRAVEEIINVE